MHSEIFTIESINYGVIYYMISYMMNGELLLTKN